jgi:diguanylate cyclase (GGDEF)-like protein/PAS domain S-box-containing protein
MLIEPMTPNTAPSSTFTLTDAYLALARDWSLWQAPLDEIRQVLSRSVSQALNVERTSIWSLHEDGAVLAMDCLYTRGPDAYHTGDSLEVAEYPAYFSALETSRVIAANDAVTDPRTREFADDYLTPLGIGALLDATLRSLGSAQGMICVEHVGGARIWRNDEVDFVCSVADLFAQLLLHHETRHKAIEVSALNVQLRTILDSASYAIIGANNHGTIVLFNKAAERMLGYRCDEVLGILSPVKLHDPTEIAVHAAELSRKLGLPIEADFELFATLVKLGQFEEREWTYIRKDGSRLPVRLTVTPLCDPQGTQTGYLGIASDLTQSQLSAQALLDSEHRYRILFESASDAVLVGSRRTTDLIITDCNQAALDMFQFEREALIGQPAARLHATRQPDGRLSRDGVIEFMHATNDRPFVETFEWTHIRRNGVSFETEVTIKALDLNGEPCYLATIRDISQSKAHEAALMHSEQQLQERNRILDILNQLAEQILSAHSEDAIARLTLTALRDIVGCEYATFSFIQEGAVTRRVYCRQGDEISPTDIPSGWPSLSREAIASNRVQFSQAVELDTRIPPERRAYFRKLGINSLICTPMSMGGKALGLASVLFSETISFSPALVDACTTVSRMISLALTNARQIATLNSQARHDSLTGLPNRLALHDAFHTLQQGVAPPPSALLLMDLDHFKDINDTLGHPVGDRLLQEIGQRLSSALNQPGSLACRLGGDEFALLLPGIDDQNEALAIAQELTRTIRQPFAIEGMSLTIGTSIGISLYPRNASDIHSLLRTADVAMYEAKHKGLGCLLYARGDDRHTPERLALMSDLDSAIDRGELRVHYQPKITLANSRVIGFEALARWQHPRQGLLSPARFMPLAEVSEIIHPFTEEILRLALDQQRRWRDEGHLFSVAVNLSARNLVDDRVIDTVERLLQAYGTPPQMLELEITETTLMTDPEGAARRLRRVAELGVRISIDDFGTGYSSLGYLRNLPIDTLKIDRSFIQELAHHAADATIVRSIISLAHNLGLSVVAEGIEDTHTQEILAAIGCDQAQGYHFSPPLPGDEVAAWLSRWTTSIASMPPGHALRREARRL